MIRRTKLMAAQIAAHADSARLSLSGTFAGLGRYWPFIVLLIGLAAVGACRASDAPPVPPTPAAQQVQPVPTPGPLPAPTRWVDPAPIGRSYLPAEATTVLLLGTDRRSDDSGYDNTDMLMLLYLDPGARRAVVLSVPRDLYVEIPGHGEGRINTAYALGEQDGTGGLALARQTVSNTLGIPVGHAALLDFRACVMLIDAVGGLDVDVPYAISDPTYPDGGTGYDPFYLPAGQHHLDGEMALKYARTRATAGGDFDRTTRQRQLLLAVRERITNLDLLPDLISRSPELWSGLRGAVETDLTLSEIVDLAVLASRVPVDQIVTAGIDQACTSFWTTSGGADVLILDPDTAEVLISDLFASPSAAAVTQ